jgi:hypothetical protein
MASLLQLQLLSARPLRWPLSGRRLLRPRREKAFIELEKPAPRSSTNGFTVLKSRIELAVMGPIRRCRLYNRLL